MWMPASGASQAEEQPVPKPRLSEKVQEVEGVGEDGLPVPLKDVEQRECAGALCPSAREGGAGVHRLPLPLAGKGVGVVSMELDRVGCGQQEEGGPGTDLGGEGVIFLQHLAAALAFQLLHHLAWGKDGYLVRTKHPIQGHSPIRGPAPPPNAPGLPHSLLLVCASQAGFTCSPLASRTVCHKSECPKSGPELPPVTLGVTEVGVYLLVQCWGHF